MGGRFSGEEAAYQSGQVAAINVRIAADQNVPNAAITRVRGSFNDGPSSGWLPEWLVARGIDQEKPENQCPGRDLNPHSRYQPGDFKSPVSANSTTWAGGFFIEFRLIL